MPQLIPTPPGSRRLTALPFRPALPWLLVLLAACGGGGTDPVPTPPPRAAAALVPAQPGELTAYLRDRVRQRQGEGTPLPTFATGGGAADLSAVATSSAAGTWLQEPGVDEDDLIKHDGGAVFTLHDATVRHDRLEDDGTLTRLQSLTLAPEPGEALTRFTGLYLADTAVPLVAIGQSWELGGWQSGCAAEACPSLGLISVAPTISRVLIQPLTRAPQMAAGERIVIDGRWVGSRRIGDRLVVVTTHEPALAVDVLPPSATAAEREAAIAALQAGDLLPQIRIGNRAPAPLIDETDCYLQPANASLAVEITTVTVFDLASATLARQSRCFVGGTEAMYMAPDALFLATTRNRYESLGATAVYPASTQTDLHRFALDDTGASYRASGSVDGHLGWDPERKSQRLSAWNGHLRVLSFTGSDGWLTAADAASTAPSPATLTVLREEGSALREVSRLPNAQRPGALGKPGEQVYAVRFLGDRGYVVTFRLVDPLYVLDLSDPTAPFAAGELELPGFSQDLFAVGNGWLLGVGRDADASGRVGGLKLALFDVRDAAQPRLQDSRVLGGAGSVSALDFSRHGIHLAASDGITRVALPVALALDGGQAHGLQRIEIDPTAGSLLLKPLLARTPEPPGASVAADRSLLIGDQGVWLSDDLVTGWAW